MFRITLISFLFSLKTFASWGSGGGLEVLKTSENPWFVKNTKVVTYCVRINKRHFSQTREFSEKQIKRAIEFWRKQFSKAQSWDFDLATQKFILGKCRSNTDIVFQLGKLTFFQRLKFKNPSSYIGRTVRTHYDFKNLRARGYIYISPDSGPKRYRGKDLIDQAWSYKEGGLLYKILVHELGHVFGVKHLGSSTTVTSELYGSHILNKAYASPFSRLDDPDGPFDIREALAVLMRERNFDPRTIKFFNLPKAHKMIAHWYRDDSRIEIYSNTFPTTKWTKLGQIKVDNISKKPASSHVVTLGLTKSQNVFRRASYRNYLIGPRAIQRIYAGTFKRIDGKEFPASIVLDQLYTGWVIINGLVDGKWVTDLLWRRNRAKITTFKVPVSELKSGHDI